MWVFLKSRHPAWSPPAAQRHNRRQSGLQISRLFALHSFNVPQMLCVKFKHTHTHKLWSIMIIAILNFFYLCPLLIYETDNVRRTFIKRERLCGCMSHDVTRQAQRCTETSERCEAFSGNSLLNKCQVLEGVLLSSRVLPALSVQCVCWDRAVPPETLVK